MTNAKLAIAGAILLAMALVVTFISGNSMASLPLLLGLVCAGIALVVVAFLRSMLAQASLTGTGATFAAGAIMVAQFPMMALLLPEAFEGASEAIAILGIVILIGTAIYWLRSVVTTP